MRPAGPSPTWPDMPPTVPVRRRRRLLPLLAGCGAFVLAAVGGAAGYLLVSGNEPAGRAGTAATTTAAAAGKVFTADWPDITALPDPCASVSPNTLGQVAPGATAERQDRSADGEYDITRHCAWSSTEGGRSRSLDVSLNLQRSEGATNGARSVAQTLSGWWRQYDAEARSTANPDTKAITAKRVPGIGSEAFYLYKLTGGKLGESGHINVEARVCNVGIRLSLGGYDNPSADPLDYSSQKGIDEATATRQALQAVREIVPHVAKAA